MRARGNVFDCSGGIAWTRFPCVLVQICRSTQCGECESWNYFLLMFAISICLFSLAVGGIEWHKPTYHHSITLFLLRMHIPYMYNCTCTRIGEYEFTVCHWHWLNGSLGKYNVSYVILHFLSLFSFSSSRCASCVSCIFGLNPQFFVSTAREIWQCAKYHRWRQIKFRCCRNPKTVKMKPSAEKIMPIDFFLLRFESIHSSIYISRGAIWTCWEEHIT